MIKNHSLLLVLQICSRINLLIIPQHQLQACLEVLQFRKQIWAHYLLHPSLINKIISLKKTKKRKVNLRSHNKLHTIYLWISQLLLINYFLLQMCQIYFLMLLILQIISKHLRAQLGRNNKNLHIRIHLQLQKYLNYGQTKAMVDSLVHQILKTICLAVSRIGLLKQKLLWIQFPKNNSLSQSQNQRLWIQIKKRNLHKNQYLAYNLNLTGY